MHGTVAGAFTGLEAGLEIDDRYAHLGRPLGAAVDLEGQPAAADPEQVAPADEVEVLGRGLAGHKVRQKRRAGEEGQAEVQAGQAEAGQLLAGERLAEVRVALAHKGVDVRAADQNWEHRETGNGGEIGPDIHSHLACQGIEYRLDDACCGTQILRQTSCNRHRFSWLDAESKGA